MPHRSATPPNRARSLAFHAGLLMPVLAAMALGGCATTPRIDYSAAQGSRAEIAGFADIRHWADAPLSEWVAWRADWLADRNAEAKPSPRAILAISSGSDKGAFAAGYLNGCSEVGDRPSYDLVTGVSTGALIAPFAFLGTAHDGDLKAIYTGVEANDIFRLRPFGVIAGKPSLAETRPLKALIAAHIDEATLTAIAAEHRRGRRLLILTTNLDAGRGMVWDVGAIAASKAPGRLALVRDILLASASIPGVFPPVMIDATADGRRFAEMHVDGGSTQSVLAVPPSVVWNGADPTSAGGSITILYNGAAGPGHEVVALSPFAILQRSLATMISHADQTTLLSYRAFAEVNGLSLHLATIGDEFDVPHPTLFDRDYMKALFAYGKAKAVTDRCASNDPLESP